MCSCSERVDTGDEAGGGGTSADVKIQLGGVLSGSASAAVSKGFRGVLSGVVLNGVRLLELSAERGDIVVQGDATRLQSLAQSKYSPAHNYPADQPLMLNVSSCKGTFYSVKRLVANSSTVYRLVMSEIK